MSTLNRWFAVGLLATSAASHAAAQVEVVDLLAKYTLHRPDPGSVEFGLNEPVTDSFQNTSKRSEISVATTFDGSSSFSLVLDASVGAGTEFCCGALEFDFLIRLRNATAAELPFGLTSSVELTGNASFKQAFVEVEPVGCTRLGNGGPGVPACSGDLGALPADFTGTLPADGGTTLRVQVALGAPSAGGQGDGSARFLLNLGLTFGNSRTIRWDEPAGGAYTTAENWNPEVVPVGDGVRFDRAIFGLPATPSPIQITASNATAGLWEIDGMNWDLLGSARVLGDSSKPDVPALVVQDGGKFGIVSSSTLETAGTVVGLTAGAEAQVFVEGVSPRWTDTEVLIIGAIGPGLVKVGQGGTLNVQGPIQMGDTPGFSDGDGTLKVENGGSVTATELTAGRAGGSSGAIEVRGVGAAAPSKLEIGGRMTLGFENGRGTLLIEDGGSVQVTGGALIGQNTTASQARVTISGARVASGLPSRLDVRSSFEVAGDLVADVEVKDGAVLETESARVGLLSAHGKVTVHNPDPSFGPVDLTQAVSGAFWLNSGTLTVSSLVGDDPSNLSEITIEQRGHVLTEGLAIGSDAVQRGRVTVSGEGSELVVLDALNVRHGELSIDSGARARSGVSQVGVGGEDAGTDAVLNKVTIDGSAIRESRWNVRGDLTVGGNGGHGTILLDGAFPLSLLGGAGAVLEVDGTLTVNLGGRIEGRGALLVPLARRVVNQGGAIAPGLSPGTIVIDGDYEQTEAGVLEIEVAGLEEGQFDVLHVTGDATLAGKVDLKFIDGFVPQPGDDVNFVVVDGTITGRLTGSTLIDIPADDADNTIGVAEVVWEVTPEGTCRMTVTDVVASDGSALDGPALPDCGAGLCGVGAVPLMPLTLIGLATLKVSRRRRVR